MTKKLSKIAVFDVGKTNSKLVVLDADSFEEIDSLRQDNAVVPSGPYPHINTDAQWAFLCDGLKDLQSRHGIDALAITTHGATGALVTDNDLAMPVMDYEFEYPQPIIDAYSKIRPPFEQTFSPLMPGGLNLAAQLHYQKTTDPAAYEQARYFLMFPQYWSWRLTGVARSERTSLGTHTDLWQPRADTFSDLVGTAFEASLFPPLGLPGDTFPVSEAAARVTGLPPGTPVTSGIHDSNASLLPWLDTGGSLSVVSSGTWTVIMSVGGKLDHLDQTRDMLANVDARGRPVPTARFMGGREYEMLSEGATAEISLDDVVSLIEARRCPLPGRVQGVGPYPTGPDGWMGEAAKTDREKVAGATLYVALMTQTSLGLTESSDRIVIEGPFAGNRIYAELLAALVDQPVYVSGDATGTSTGAAMLLVRGKSATLGDAVRPANIANLREFAQDWRKISEDLIKTR